MESPRRTLYPPAASQWMVGRQHARVLDLGSDQGDFAAMLKSDGHDVFCLDRRTASVDHVTESLGTQLHVVAQAESLPYLSCLFDVVTTSESLHRFAPGLALIEMARVLRPGGHLAVVYNTRDETVPWVKRLKALMQSADPQAMSVDLVQTATTLLTESPYFRDAERRNFRNWVPISRSGLIEMVQRRPATAALSPESQECLLEAVGELYDSSARSPEPLLLPFQASCWRAQVDHSQLSIDESVDHVLEIRL